MKILFKNFFKSLLKNKSLIFSLLVLLAASNFIVAASINLSQSFTNSVKRLNKKGSKAGVVSENPSSLGNLDFSISLSNEPITIISSNIELQPRIGQGGKKTYHLEDNTLFPFDYQQFYDLNGKPIRNIISSKTKIPDNSFDNGITYNPDWKHINEAFTFDLNKDRSLWKLNYGEIYEKSIDSGIKSSIAYFPTSGYALSLVKKTNKGEAGGEVLINPTAMLYNKYGLPSFYFNKGNLTQDISFVGVHTRADEKLLKQNKNWRDGNGVGIPEIAFNRANKFDFNGSTSYIVFPRNISPKYYDYMEQDTRWMIWALSKYTKPVEVKNPFSFDVNLSDDSSTSTLMKNFIKYNPQVIEQAFNIVFGDLNVTNEETLYDPSTVQNPITLKKKPNNEYSIILALPPSAYQEFEENQSKQENTLNSILSNFKTYISNEMSKAISQVFVKGFDLYLKDNKVDRAIEKEFFYYDKKTDKDFLFVPKRHSKTNSPVVTKGSGLQYDDQIERLIKSFTDTDKNGKFANTFFKEFLNLLNSIPQDIVNKLNKPTKNNKIDGNNYLYFLLIKYCTYKINELLKDVKDNSIPLSVRKSPYFIIFTKMMGRPGGQISIETNKIMLDLSPEAHRQCISLGIPTLSFSFFSNMFVLINETFANENDKKYLPTKTSNETISFWLKQIEDLRKKQEEYDKQNKTTGLKKDFFTDWLKTLKEDQLVLSYQAITQIFKSNGNEFTKYLDTLPNNYKIPYNSNTFLINGFALSPDFAFPIISPVSPIPNSKKQSLVYLTDRAFNSLNVNYSSISSYSTYSSNKLKDKQIVKLINDYQVNTIGKVNFRVSKLNEANWLNTVWLRSFFPQKMKNVVFILSIVSSLFLICLAIFIVILLLRSFMQNIIVPISVCIANGITFKKIFLNNLINMGIIATIAGTIGYLASFFTQSLILKLFSSIWFIPIAPIGFSPFILLGGILITFGILGAVLWYSLYKKLKEPIPNIISNKESVKANLITKLLRRNWIKVPLLTKFSFGFGSINLGRILALSLIGSTALGVVSSCIGIGAKFDNSKNKTQLSRNYNYSYNLIDVNESTGLYKSQDPTRLGFEDPNLGITSIYKNKNTPYVDKPLTGNEQEDLNNELSAKAIPKHGDESNLMLNKTNPGRLSNLLFPYVAVYFELKDKKQDIFFNSNLSIFLLQMTINAGLAIGDLNLWSYIAPLVPNWLLAQLETQTNIFKDTIMDYYGEWYYKFLDLSERSPNEYLINDNDNNPATLSLDKVQKKHNGYYYCEIERNNKKYRTKPYYVWTDSKQWYWDRDVTNTNHRFEIKQDQNIKIDASNETFYQYRNNNTFVANENKKTTITPEDKKISWNFIPAYDWRRALGGNGKDITNGASDYAQIKCGKDFMDFATTIYSDPRITLFDSKLSYGIIPFKQYDKETNPHGDEKATKVEANASFGTKWLEDLDNQRINMLGIDPNSELIKLFDTKNNLLNNKLVSNSNTINVIVNQGAALKYKLKVDDEFDATILNNSLINSYDVLNQYIKFNNPINTSFKFKVVGIYKDSFGLQFMINQKDANRITGLDQMRYYHSLNEAPTLYNENITDEVLLKQRMPFNTIISNSKKMDISNTSLPFYTYANLWSFVSKTNELNFAKADINQALRMFDYLVTYNPEMIKLIAQKIKIEYDPNFIINPDITQQRNEIIKFFKSKFSPNKLAKALEGIGLKNINSSAIANVMDNNVLYGVYDVISNLSTTLIASSTIVLVLLLLVVSITTALSVIMNLSKNIDLMRVMGYSPRNIIISLILTFLPVFAISLVGGLGIIFGLNYSIQYLLFNLTQIFISPALDGLTYGIGTVILLLILITSIGFAWLKIKRNKLDSSIKF